MPPEPINSLAYWERRHASGDWMDAGGREQTRHFAVAQLRRLRLPKNFSGLLVDFGCGQGDAFPVYREALPKARLLGIDVSPSAIQRCHADYGHLGEFVVGNQDVVPRCDILIASNVLEHFDNDVEVARALRAKANVLVIVVPYREQHLIAEHRRAYDRSRFTELEPAELKVFACRGWSQYGLRSHWWQIRVKNLLRPLVGKPPLRRRLQVMYVFR